MSWRMQVFSGVSFGRPSELRSPKAKSAAPPRTEQEKWERVLAKVWSKEHR